VSENQELFGHIALELGFLTRGRLLEAGRLQNNPDESRRLGEILLDLGWLTNEQLQQILSEQRERMKAVTPAPAATDEVAEPTPARLARVEPVDSSSLESLEDILRWAVDVGASDVHLHSGSSLRFRIHGHVEPVTFDALTAERVEALTARLLEGEPAQLVAEEGQADFALTLPGLTRFRINAYRQQKGLDVVLRVVPQQPPDLEHLGLPHSLARFTTYHQGMVLVTGPTGCGKTSTLAALVNIINQERKEHVITAEDPIEFLHEPRGCVINQRQVRIHSESFPKILRAALREDPDIIVLGELRDTETISLALTAAETGHLVLGTLHTGGAIRTIDRLIGAFPPNEQEQVRLMLSESLRAVVSQRLVQKADGTGRVPALEIMVVTRAVSNLIREKKVFQIQSILQTQRDKGMQLLEHALDDLVSRGVITEEEAAKHA
jgi:twitching motility protein PilT